MKFLKIFKLLFGSYSDIRDVYNILKDGITKDEIDDLCNKLLEFVNDIMKEEGKPLINTKLAFDLANCIVSGLNVYAIIKDYIKQIKDKK